MGVQVIFNREAAAKAGAIFTALQSLDPQFEEESCSPFYVTYMVTIPDTPEQSGIKTADYAGFDESFVQCDFNAWGSNRQPLTAFLESNGIEYEVV